MTINFKLLCSKTSLETVKERLKKYLSREHYYQIRN